MLHAMSFWAMELASWFTKEKMGHAQRLLILSLAILMSQDTKQEILGAPSLAPSLQVMKSAELILLGSTFAHYLRYILYSASKILKLIFFYGSMLWTSLERDFWDSLFSTQLLRNGGKLILREHMFSRCGYIKTKSQRSLISRLLTRIKLKVEISWFILTKNFWSLRVKT